MFGLLYFAKSGEGQSRHFETSETNINQGSLKAVVYNFLAYVAILFVITYVTSVDPV